MRNEIACVFTFLVAVGCGGGSDATNSKLIILPNGAVKDEWFDQWERGAPAMGCKVREKKEGWLSLDCGEKGAISFLRSDNFVMSCTKLDKEPCAKFADDLQSAGQKK